MEIVFGKKWLWQDNQEQGQYEIYNMGGNKIENKIASFSPDAPEEDFEIDQFLNTIVDIHNYTITIQENDPLYAKLIHAMFRLILIRSRNSPREITEMNVGLVSDAIDEIVKRDRVSSKYFQQAFAVDDESNE